MARVRLVGCVLLACGAAGCFDTPHESRVRVSVGGLPAAAGVMYSPDSVEVAVVFATGGGAVDGGAVDAGAGASPDVQRVIQWDGTDPMVFYVQVPARTYPAVRVEARVNLLCRRNGTDQVTATPLAAGRVNGAVVVTEDDAAEVQVGVAPVALACPTM